MKALKRWLAIGLVSIATLSHPGLLQAQTPPTFSACAWPLQVSPEGFGNYLAPDDQARYWMMPFEAAYDSMTIEGTYPAARYFSFVAYAGNADGRPVRTAGHLFDAIIAPDPGSGINPFIPYNGQRRPPKPDVGTYTINVVREATEVPVTNGANTIVVDENPAWIALRIYVPTADDALGGLALSGGVPLPTVTLTSGDDEASVTVLEPCPIPASTDSPDYFPMRSINKFADVLGFLRFLFPEDFDINQHKDWDDMPEGQVWFAPPWDPPVLLFPNPDNKYLVAIPGPYQPGKMLVIHAKAPTFPESTAGGPPNRKHEERRGKEPDVRYWSICLNDMELPIGTVRCLADRSIKSQGHGYTIVISNDLVRPRWLRPNVNWLPWGDERYPKLLFYRHMIPVESESEYADIPFDYAIQKVVVGCWEGKDTGERDECIHEEAVIDFLLPDLPSRAEVTEAGPNVQAIMDEYYPVAAWCDEDTFRRGGWRACLGE